MKPLRHLVRVDQLDQEMVTHILKRAREMRIVAQHHGSQRLTGYVAAMLFYEPSTRTRLSFETAMHRLGGRVIGTENAGEFSSVTKGESLPDTIRVISGYADVIVLRHKETGSAEIAAQVGLRPIINAGDGTGEHPTQALLDVFTIHDKLGGSFGDLTIAMVGDLKHGRTVHSLVRLLLPHKPRFLFVSPNSLRLPRQLIAEVARVGARYEETTDFERAVREADALYMLRLQKERISDPAEREQDPYVLNRERMEIAKPRMIIMHPLPRNEEIAEEVDGDPRAAYFEQSDNGLFVRMALLELILLNGHS